MFNFLFPPYPLFYLLICFLPLQIFINDISNPRSLEKSLDLHQFLVAIACENASHKIFIKSRVLLYLPKSPKKWTFDKKNVLQNIEKIRKKNHEKTDAHEIQLRTKSTY